MAYKILQNVWFVPIRTNNIKKKWLFMHISTFPNVVGGG
jgi:hypothetical protein